MTDSTPLTLAEKASLASGADFWTTKAVRDIPSVYLTDGPHGVRKQGDHVDHLGVSMSYPATCFPPASGLSQSWNTDLARRVGAALGIEARAIGVNVLLGPGVNIKRHPLGGRNFEYFSEDPHLAGALGAAWVTGIQSEHVGASLKHFAVNNQETDRHRISADVDARTLREIYLRAFQIIVRDANPWTVMASYNRINGVPASESEFLLTQVLRDEWGYDGVVVSDWGAVGDRVAAARAGLDLEMPAADGTDEQLLDAVIEGTLPVEVLDRISDRVRRLAQRAHADTTGAGVPFDVDTHHALAQEAAAQSIVLLKNEDDLLPLNGGTSVAVIGEAAATPRFQGGGSSFVNTTRVDVAVEELRRLGGDAVRYAAGYSSDPAAAGDELLAEAVAAAREADVAIVFIAAPLESEGIDRENLELPADQVALVQGVLAANPHTIVVVAHGGAVQLSAIGSVPAILDCALSGQGGGRAIADILYGNVNPSGRLSETVPLRLEDTPAFGIFPGEHGHALYGEGLFVGYRWYDTRDITVAYPFGHGLSYTTFEYSGLTLDVTDEGIAATVTITNTGSRAGREVAQFYVAVPGSEVTRPVHELKGFATIALKPAQSEDVTVLLRRDDLAYWDTRGETWTLESGDYVVSVGASSRDIRETAIATVVGDVVHVELTMHSTIGELLANPFTKTAIEAALSSAFGAADNPAVGGNVVQMISPSPLHSVVGLLGEAFDAAEFDELLDAANASATTDAR
ncbi:glycoside hydrolase family 3 C-terminal domain-containing protein [Microbacterium rhizomatis]|uniref:Exo-alpha-(1->6)-L-arabinopyranosidase n=1 Tax=Microbacterium rhizomatis TaxID=1631477 RepID=A0A5J5IXA9_9MICO|nr:glycoside hydrolase family 3 C-terminal domain-containing protein [Microbacterium rhizomatis]KAA9105885.1 beta-glucosidase [Microbacterium rhizomatis]